MANRKELIEVMKVIKNHCKNTTQCKDCPIQNECLNTYWGNGYTPSDWELRRVKQNE